MKPYTTLQLVLFVVLSVVLTSGFIALIFALPE